MYHDHSCDHLHIRAPHVFFTIHLNHMHHTGSQENDAVMQPKEQKVTEVEEHEEELQACLEVLSLSRKASSGTF